SAAARRLGEQLGNVEVDHAGAQVEGDRAGVVADRIREQRVGDSRHRVVDALDSDRGARDVDVGDDDIESVEQAGHVAQEVVEYTIGGHEVTHRLDRSIDDVVDAVDDIAHERAAQAQVQVRDAVLGGDHVRGRLGHRPEGA